MERLKQRVAVVTGGSSGIGFETAKLLAMKGAFVFLTGRRRRELDDAVAKIGVNAKGLGRGLINPGPEAG